MAMAVAERLRNQGIGVTVVDPRWVLPVPEAIGELATAHKLVVTIEDNGVHGGVGSAVSAALRRAEIDVPCRDVGVPQEFLAHASRGEVLADVGLTDQNIARQITGWVAALGSAVSASRGQPAARLSHRAALGFPLCASRRKCSIFAACRGHLRLSRGVARSNSLADHGRRTRAVEGRGPLLRLPGLRHLLPASKAAPTAKPVLLAIHGYPFNSWDWALIWPTLAERFTVIAPDMIGMGFSAKPVAYEYSVADHADMHEALLAAPGHRVRAHPRPRPRRLGRPGAAGPPRVRRAVVRLAALSSRSPGSTAACSTRHTRRAPCRS